MKLPDPCEKCKPQGGNHQLIEGRGMARCDCRRGVTLARGDQIRRMYREVPSDIEIPKPTPAAIRAARQAAGALKGIPGCAWDSDAQVFITNELLALARNADQLRWLVKRAIRLYHKWPGVRELRVLFCSKYMPADGHEIFGSEVFPEGIPSENPKPEINWKQIEAGRGTNQEIIDIGKRKALPPVKQRKVAAHEEFEPTERRSALP